MISIWMLADIVCMCKHSGKLATHTMAVGIRVSKAVLLT